jgi:hypothetical protein
LALLSEHLLPSLEPDSVLMKALQLAQVRGQVVFQEEKTSPHLPLTRFEYTTPVL